MRALTWQGRRKVSVEDVPHPTIQDPGDAIVRITSTAICGSDLHLYELFHPYLDRGDILGHESMGLVEEIGAGVQLLRVGQRVVVPFNIACGTCWMCQRGLQSQCETTQVREYGSGAALFGYTKLYGQVPGGQAEYLRVPRADYNTIPVGEELPDERYLYLSDILPTAFQAIEYAGVPDGGTLAVLGLGPVGQFVARIGAHLGYRVLAVDPVAERRELGQQYGAEVTDLEAAGEWTADLTEGRGPDSVIDAVGMEAHGSPIAHLTQKAMGILPDAVTQPMMQEAGVDRTAALLASIDMVRRGGTVSLSGVYAGNADVLPMKTLFDKQITMRMGQCNVKRWIDELLPLVERDDDPLGTANLATHHVSLEEAPSMYEKFQKKQDGCIKVVLHPDS